jgi:sporulation protein YtfJ
MDKRPISEMMETAMQKIKEMIDANTIVGEPITTADDIVLIPVSRVSIGFAGGGGGKGEAEAKGNCSGVGTGFKVEPVAFVVIKSDDVRILYIAPPAETAVERLIDAAPPIIDKISGIISGFAEKNDEEQDEQL